MPHSNRKAVTRSLLFGLLTIAVISRAQTLNLPPRPADAPAGTQLAALLADLSRVDREARIYAEMARGNVPDFLRRLMPVTITQQVAGITHTATVHVTPDYLALGTDADYLLMPMTPVLGQRLAHLLGGSLPTSKLVNLCWTNAAVRLIPQPIAPSAAMTSVPVFAQHNMMVCTQRLISSQPLGALVSGHKKDVVISAFNYTRLKPGVSRPVVIYGWHQLSGVPIQPLYNGHGETYADYSHGIRLVQQAMTLDQTPAVLSNVLTHSVLAALLSDEGPLDRSIYPTAAWPPVIVVGPTNIKTAAGSAVTFHLLAAGDPPLAYRWQHDGTNLPAATTAAVTIAAATVGQTGPYQVSVSNAAGVVTSCLVTLQLATNREARAGH